MTLPQAWRERIEEYVRPLHTELDGVETFSRVERLEARLADLADGVEHETRLLELLTLFHAVVDRLGNLGAGGRWQLLLRGLGLADPEISRLRRGLERWATDPRTAEEELLHDAVLLDRCGVEAALGRLLLAGRKRLPLDRALAQLDAGPEPERFRSAEGRERAVRSFAATGEWLEDLRRRLASERGSTIDPPST